MDIVLLLLHEEDVLLLTLISLSSGSSCSVLLLGPARAKQKLSQTKLYIMFASKGFVTKTKTLLLLVILRRVQVKNSSQLCRLSSCLSSSESSKFGSLPHMKAALVEVIIVNESDD